MSASPAVAPSTLKVPYYAFVSGAKDVEAVKNFAESKQLPGANALEGDITTATDFLRTNASPAVLLVEVASAQTAADQLTKLAEVCDPETKVITIGTVNEYSFYCWMMELGICSYLLKPLNAQALDSAWTKATEVPAPSTAKAKDPAKVIGFIGARGGVGNTTLALLFTAMLAESSGKKTAIVDLDPQDGSVSLLMDVDPSRGLREALEKPDRIDSLFLDRVMQKTEAGFYVLSAEEPLHAPISYHEHAGETLLNELKSQFDYVVLDLPRHVNHFTRQFITQCTTTFVVTDMSLHGLRDSLRLTDFFRDALRIPPPKIVASRVGMAAKQEMGDAEFKKGLNADIDYHVPFAPDFFMQLGSSLEALKNKKAPAHKVLMQMVAGVLPEQDAAEGEPKKRAGFLKLGK